MSGVESPILKFNFPAAEQTRVWEHNEDVQPHYDQPSKDSPYLHGATRLMLHLVSSSRRLHRGPFDIIGGQTRPSNELVAPLYRITLL